MTAINYEAGENEFKCPKIYSENGSLRYFLMNKEFPEKYIFVNASQDYGYGDYSKISWHSSIRIVK